MSASAAPPTQIEIVDHLGPGTRRSLADDVLDGLTRPFKELSPKHLYDARGSELFDQICELPEYYPTRTERALLEGLSEEIVAATRPVELVELGSGSADKTRVLLDAMRDTGRLARYVPLDVSETALRDSAQRLVGEYPGLMVHGVVGDFERHLDRVPARVGPRIVAFLGGTIGNFPPGTRRRFLRAVRRQLREDDRLLLGTGLVTDRARMVAAYDDSAGVTAAFNLNLLAVLNRELGADFDVRGFEHVALYDAHHDWIEMRLRASWEQAVHIAELGIDVRFAAGEEMRTEISAKFTRERVETDLRAAGLALSDWHTDAEGLFGLSLSRPAGSAAR